jgi:hypothetical protein
MAVLLINTLFFAVLYFVISKISYYAQLAVCMTYLIGGGALGLWYVIYNRGFVTKGKTPDMLSADIPYDERVAMVEDGRRRMERSRWALLIIIPILATFLLDMIYLFLIPEELFG